MTSANQTPSSGPSTPYSREWREALTGRDLLNWAFPSVTEISEAAIEGIFCKKDENSIIPCSEIATLQTIPSAKNLLYAKRLIGELDTGARTRSHTNEGSWAVRIGSFGNFDKTTIKLLDPIVFEAMDMARGIREMLKWIGDNASSARDPFAVWFRDQLLNAPNIMQLSFRASTHVPLNLSSALFFRNEQYIDDEAIRLVLDLFSEHYTANNQYIFIPPLRIQQWTSSTKYNKSFLWKKEELESGRVEKAFAVVHMQHLDHWGAVQIDFINQELSFGDSLAMNCPITVESGIRKWLVACKIGENKWKRGMGLFRIARQPSTSGSCGIIALNAIEHAVNPSISLWEPQSAVEHRMRMLELVTAYSTLSPPEVPEVPKEGSSDSSEVGQDEESGQQKDVEGESQSGSCDGSQSDSETGGYYDREGYRLSDTDEDSQRNTNGEETEDDEERQCSNLASEAGSKDIAHWEPRFHYVFDSFPEAEAAIKTWARRSGFRARIGQANYSERPRVVFLCKHSGKSKSSKTSDPSMQRRSKSGRKQCPFKLTIRSPNIIAPLWHITTLEREHNHACEVEAGVHIDPLSQEVLGKIGHYAAGGLSLDNIMYLLQTDFVGGMFHRRQVSNAIQKVKALKKCACDYSEASALVKVLEDRIRQDNGWFFKIERDQKNRLSKVFWMSPSQRSCYGRYRDVVLNDNTSNTNRFNMYLNVFVVVDSAGRSRLVASSLVLNETTEDYAWILSALLEACDGKAPGVIIVDDDPAMEAACRDILADTILLNCIWHMSENLKKKLRSPLRDEWELFYSSFWRVRNSITVHEFETRWEEEVAVYGEEDEKVRSYLNRLYQKRAKWAWAWIGVKFTAGMASTQRVKGIHAVLKKNLSRKTELVSLFDKIEEVLASQERTSEYLLYRMDQNDGPTVSTVARQIFNSVYERNNHFLGVAARNQMAMEMIRSFYYRSKLCEPAEFLAPLSRNGSHEPNERIELSARQDRRKFSLDSFVSRIGTQQITFAYEVTYMLDHTGAERQQLVVLNDGSYVCSCLLLQNSGIVCRHFFHLTTVTPRCRYHISLIPRRWFRDTLQDDPELDVSTEAFQYAMSHYQVESETPPITYMDDLRRVFVPPIAVPSEDQALISRKRKYAALTALTKRPVNSVENDPDVYDAVLSKLEEAIIEGRDSTYIENPVKGNQKGRPRSKRHKSFLEKLRKESHQKKTSRILAIQT